MAVFEILPKKSKRSTLLHLHETNIVQNAVWFFERAFREIFYSSLGGIAVHNSTGIYCLPIKSEVGFVNQVRQTCSRNAYPFCPAKLGESKQEALCLLHDAFGATTTCTSLHHLIFTASVCERTNSLFNCLLIYGLYCHVDLVGWFKEPQGEHFPLVLFFK